MAINVSCFTFFIPNIYLSTRYPMTEDPNEKLSLTTRVFKKAADPLIFQDHYSKPNKRADPWPANLIPFSILDDFPKKFRQNLSKCLQNFEEKTCVRFRYMPDFQGEDLEIATDNIIKPLIIIWRCPFSNYTSIRYDHQGGNW
uniref:Uncharacterized protein n=1 Tax=Romanomermis culicivorax TaxID=13658 RepID=A0A915L841_ROMCU